MFEWLRKNKSIANKNKIPLFVFYYIICCLSLPAFVISNKYDNILFILILFYLTASPSLSTLIESPHHILFWVLSIPPLLSLGKLLRQNQNFQTLTSCRVGSVSRILWTDVHTEKNSQALDSFNAPWIIIGKSVIYLSCVSMKFSIWFCAKRRMEFRWLLPPMLCFPLQSSDFHLIPDKIGKNFTLPEVSYKYISLTDS